MKLKIMIYLRIKKRRVYSPPNHFTSCKGISNLIPLHFGSYRFIPQLSQYSVLIILSVFSMLFVAEAVHVQKIVELLNTKNQTILRAAIEPISDKYTLARSVLLIFTFIWSAYEYRSTKKKLGLSS